MDEPASLWDPSWWAGVFVLSQGAAAVGLNAAWWARSYSFFNKRVVFDSAQLGDYNNTDHVLVCIAIAAAGTLLHLLMSLPFNADKHYKRTMKGKVFPILYCWITGLTAAFVLVAYAYFLINLAQFNDAYAKAGFHTLRNNALPSAAFVLTVAYLSGQTGMVIATRPDLEFNWMASKGGSV
jgi:TM2 domain-containing membrane protein YozV